MGKSTTYRYRLETPALRAVEEYFRLKAANQTFLTTVTMTRFAAAAAITE
jgi:hypothetical protein